MMVFFGGALEVALRHIQSCDVVGFIDKLDTFEEDSGRALSLPVRFQKSNKTSINYPCFDAQPPSVQVRIKEIYAEYLMSYQAAKSGAEV